MASVVTDDNGSDTGAKIKSLPSNSSAENTTGELSHATRELSLDSEDEYISSGDEALDLLETSDSTHRLTYGSSISEHIGYFQKALDSALDSVRMDSSLVLQAQLSGTLNDKAKCLMAKQGEIISSISRLKECYKQNIVKNKLGLLEKDLDELSVRINRLKHGKSKQSIFGKPSTLGVVETYPIEYNQARDQVLERTTDM